MSLQQVTLCECEGNVNNLGVPGCLTELGAPRRFWFGEVFKADGTRNAFDPSVTLDLAFFNTFFKNETPQDRILPSVNVKDFLPEKEDPVIEDAASGAKTVVREGVITHTAVFWVNDPYKYKAIFDSRKCKENAVWIEDTKGNIIGEATSDGKLGGRRVEVNSLVATVTDPMFTERPKLTVTWSYQLISGDEKVDFIKAADLASDFSTDLAVALLDGELEFVGDPGTLGGTFKLFTFYGSIGQRIPITGLTPTELEGFNETTPGVVTLTAASDSVTDGTYIYTHTVQTAGNIFRIQGVTTNIQGGFDLKLIKTITKAIV